MRGPSVASGLYPERRDMPESALEHALQQLRGLWLRRSGARPAALAEIVSLVDAAAGGLAVAGEAALSARISSLRSELSTDGLRDSLLAQTFALVREVAGRTLGTRHYDVQLQGGWLLARGMLVEMETGEGKTLTATLPACAAALAGIPVHVLTSNDYLSGRDADALGPLYRALGLSVGVVRESEKDDAVRRAAYACDVTYGTAKTIAFDYLRDRLARKGAQTRGFDLHLDRIEGGDHGAGLRLRGLCFAIVDEADSILIDEARTPLLLSGGGDGGPDLRRLLRRSLRLARSLEEGVDFELARTERRVKLTEAGHKHLEQLCQGLSGIWSGRIRREEMVLRALQADHLQLRDRDYIVRDGKVEIVDPLTGRAAPDRAWELGLHQLVELKEGCDLSPQRETLGRISYQHFFRRYLSLCGMTGTAREVAGELFSVYKLAAVRVEPRLPLLRRDLGTRVFLEARDSQRALVDRVLACRAEGRPVLIGTNSVEASERLAAVLCEAGLDPRVLNARHDAEEASIVTQAGEARQITVATNMAGRGTDIQLAADVAAAGGLHVIATERAEASRVDRQLYGRCARQGDPGSFEAILCLDAGENFDASRIVKLLRSLFGGSFIDTDLVSAHAQLDGEDPTDPLPAWIGLWLTSTRQRADEKRYARMRRELLEHEEGLGELLAFSGAVD